MTSHLLYTKLISAAVAGAALLGGNNSWAQSAPDQSAPAPDDQSAPADRSDVIVITGTRTEGRSVQDSAVPVDVFTAKAIEDISFTDTQDVLKTLVPSFTTARQPISDGATFVRPASLRGLSSDKTLVLVNSKRRHRAALVSTGGSGTQGPDVSTIPASALKTVEVLRDGAAAQYGSDAIAGVINFILKDSPEGGEIQFQAGTYYEDDGEDLLLAGNLGLPIGDKGFVNISVEGTTAQPTTRSQEWRTQAADPGNFGGQSSFDVPTFLAANPQYGYLFGSGEDFDTSNVQLWGQPETEAFRSFINAGYQISETMELYGFANYSNSTADGDFNYRSPVAGIHTNRIRQQNGAIFQFVTNYPAGRTPRFGGNVVDYSITGGLRGDFTDVFSYDFSGRYGKNTIYYTLWNTINPSLGPQSPTSFHPGDLVSDEWAVSADFTYTVPVSFFANPLDIGFGAEYRDEGYEIVAGDEASYIAGPYALQDPWNFCTNEAAIALRTATTAGLAAGMTNTNCQTASDPVYTQNAVGSDGFPGYPPAFSEASSRDSYAFYVDFASDVTDYLFLDLAMRYENYSDFGETFDYKVAGRWKMTDSINLRGSVGTGFRAPTPGQLGTTNVSTVFAGGGEPIAQGLFPATNPVSVFLGAKALDPEKSDNYSLGATANFGTLDVTLDFYLINISDQFYAVSPITVDAATRAALLAAGVPGADTIGQVSFFQNAFDSETYGVDLVVSYAADWGDAGTTNFTVSANYNGYQIESVNIQNANGTDLFDAEAIYDFEHGQPKFRAVFSAMHSIGQWTLVGRANYYGGYKVSNCVPNNCTPAVLSAGTTVFEIQELTEEVLFDLEAEYAFNDSFSVAVGARNVFDEYPDEGEFRLRETSNGRIYRSDSIVDWQGGFYYVRAKHKF
jgi:iron complex outermembrane recepter protein